MESQAAARPRASAPSREVLAVALAVVSIVSGGAACSRAASQPPRPQVAVVGVGPNPADATPDANLSNLPADAGSAVRRLHPSIGAAAVRVDTGRLDVGTFAVATSPSAEHTRGTLAAVGWEYAPDEVVDASTPGKAIAGTLYVLEIDVATAREIGRLPIGAAAPAEILRTGSGLVVAVERAHDLSLVWLDGARSVRSVHDVPGLGSDSGFDMTGFAAIADRLVVVDGGTNGRATTAIVLDDDGGVVARHRCRGGLPSPSPPTAIEWWDNRAVLTELTSDAGKPLCAFRVDRGARTQEATLAAGSELFVEGGVLYVGTFESAGDERVRRVGDDLRAVGPVLVDPRPREDPARPRCTGITGTAVWQQRLVEGMQVSRSVSCCGDSAPGGIFVCDPRGQP